MVDSGLRKCAVCGKTFDISFYNNYAYKKLIKGKLELYCGYNCFRVVDKELEKQEKARWEEKQGKCY